MKTVERLCEATAKAMSLGLKRGTRQAARGQKQGVAVRGGARIAFDIDGQLKAEFDKNGNFTGGLDIDLTGPILQAVPGVDATIGASAGGGTGFNRGENLEGTEKMRMEIWCEYANLAAIEEDEENFGDADANLNTFEE